MEKYSGIRGPYRLTKSVIKLVWLILLCRDDDVSTLAEKGTESFFHDLRSQEETDIDEKYIQCSN